jgi:hypothetical protein
VIVTTESLDTCPSYPIPPMQGKLVPENTS